MLTFLTIIPTESKIYRQEFENSKDEKEIDAPPPPSENNKER